MNSKPVTKRKEARWLFLMKLGRLAGCHQMCERSFFYKNYQFPLCARCTGLALGEFVIAPILLILGFNNWLFNYLAIALLAIDGIGQYFQVWKSTNLRRFLTGTLAGIGIASLAVKMVQVLFFR